MTERDYAIRSFKEITLNAAQHTEERMDLYYEKMKALMNNYQDLILENQMVLDELEQECQEKINENMAYALQYMDRCRAIQGYSSRRSSTVCAQ